MRCAIHLLQLVRSVGKLIYLAGFLSGLRKKSGQGRPPHQDGKQRTRPTANLQVPMDEVAPKNGRLTLAVAAALVVMVALAAVNVRLIRDPSIAYRAFGPSVPSRPETSLPPKRPDAGAAAKKEPCDVPPHLRFWVDLNKADEHPQAVPDKTGDAPTAAQGQSTQAVSTAVPQNDKKNDAPSVVTGTTRHREHTGSPESLKLPQSNPGKKTYTVQVGAFTNPAIAKQWALKWKARGHMVSLKPVARPQAGVIYRLYLGNFSSENQADELVKRLKSREGISALRLVVRN